MITPALLISTESRGTIDSTFLLHASIDDSDARSNCTCATSALLLRCRISSTAVSPLATVRAVMITRAPMRASPTAVVRPMPELPPVMRTVFPCMHASERIGDVWERGYVARVTQCAIRKRSAMHLEETSAQQALRSELRAYFRALMTSEVKRSLRLDGEGGP